MLQVLVIWGQREKCLKSYNLCQRLENLKSSLNPMRMFNGYVQKLLTMICIIELRIKLPF